MSESWPAHSENTTSGNLIHRHRKKDNQERPWHYPVTQRGDIGAATLAFEGQKASWVFAQPATTNESLLWRGASVRAMSNASHPPHHYERLLKTNTMTKQKVDRTADFVRKHYPGLDIPDEMLHEGIDQDRILANKLMRFDPYQGPGIAHMMVSNGIDDARPCVVSVSGEVRSSLSFMVDPVQYLADSREYALASSCVVSSGLSPIQQVSAPPRDESRPGPMHIVLRTMGGFGMYKIKTSWVLDSFRLLDMRQFSRKDTGDRHAVDIKLRNGGQGAWVMNDKGSLYDLTVQEGGVHLSACAASPREIRKETFWRVYTGWTDNECLVHSSRIINQIDSRAPGTVVNMYQPASRRSLLTSLELFPEDDRLCVVTTKEILWLDRRFSQRPLMSFKHGLSSDRTLNVRSLKTKTGHTTFLNSRNHGLTFVYDVGAENPIHFTNAPYLLSNGFRSGLNFGSVLLPGSSDDKCYSFQADDSGAVQGLECVLREGDRESESEDRIAEGSGLRTKTMPRLMLSQANGSLDRKHRFRVDMRSIYEACFLADDKPSSNEARDVLQTIEGMKEYWRRQEVPAETMLINSELAVRSSYKDVDYTRAEFLAPHLLSSSHGYHALAGGRVPLDVVVKGAPWHLDISSQIRKFCPEFSSDVKEMFDKLDDLRDPLPGLVSDQRVRAGIACSQQVAIDLCLSSDVYSSRPFAGGSSSHATLEDDIESMSLATGALSLTNAEPPSYTYGYLRPLFDADRIATPSHFGERRSHARDWGESSGTRLLLSEWTLNEDPEDYKYIDPYNGNVAYTPWRSPEENKPGNGIARPKPAPSQDHQARPPVLATARPQPPPIVAALPQSQPSVVPTQLAPGPASQPMAKAFTGTNSQSLLPSTQVMPGPHGGRPGAPKKKPAKKRVGGF